jgi:RIO-like serine/threonine protein kinase
MEDDFKAIIKIPYWISVPKSYATASEAATLTFLRSKGVPVPEVYGWSSTTENPVGVEYIIMEHVSGVSADTRSFNTTKYEKHAWLPVSSILKRRCLLYHLHLQAAYISSEISRLTYKRSYIYRVPKMRTRIPRHSA